MKRILICRPPDEWFVTTDYIDLAQFYNNIEDVARALGYEYEVDFITNQVPKHSDDTLVISHHTTGKQDGVIHVKKAYLNGYVYFDTMGYSGWAEMARYPLHDEYEYYDQDLVNNFIDHLRNDLVKNNKSKWTQPQKAFKHNKPYIFVPLQTPFDTVRQFDNFSYQEAINEFKGHHWDIVIKYHPHGKMEIDETGLIVSDASIHSLIEGCDLVLTSNSGVGFEALIHGKHVVSFGRSDFNWGTNLYKTPQQLQRAINVEHPKNQQQVNYMIWYMLNEYFIDVNNKPMIAKRLIKAMEC